MTRPLRVQFANACYHVMNRGAGAQDVFKNNTQRNIFLLLLSEITKLYGVEIHAYCLMGNHYHLLLRTPFANLSEAMRHLNSLYTKKFNKLEKTDGPLFRGRYKAILILGVKYFLQVSAYIHLNPVEANIVKRPENFRWSSFAGYKGKKKERWLFLDKTLRCFKGTDQQAQYSAYVKAYGKEKKLKKLKALYENKHLPVVIGSDKAKLLMDNMINLNLYSVEITDVTRIRTRPDLDDLSNTIANYYHIKNSEMFRKKARIGNTPRTVFMYLARNKFKYPLNKISDYLGNVSYSAVSVAIFRLSKAIKKDKKLRIEIKNIAKIFDKRI